MIKNLKRIAVLVVTAALAAVGSLSAAADGYILYAGYSFSLNNRQATIHSYEGSGELYIPATIWGYTVVGIEDFAFYGRDMQLGIEPGKRQVMVGSSCEDIRLRGETELTGEWEEVPTLRGKYCLTFTPLGDAPRRPYLPPRHALLQQLQDQLGPNPLRHLHHFLSLSEWRMGQV